MIDLTNYELDFKLENDLLLISDYTNGELLVKIPQKYAGDLSLVINDGVCSECGENINLGQVICDHCFEIAKQYRVNYG